MAHYEWDEDKNAENVATRGISFERAKEIDATTALITEDDRKDYGEPRFVVRGLIDERLYILVFTWRNGTKRVISLRKANLRERRRYVEDTGRPLGNTR